MTGIFIVSVIFLYMDSRYFRIRRPQYQKITQGVIDEIKREKWEPFYSDYVKYGPEYILRSFARNPGGSIQWSLIPAEQYENLLRRYMDDPVTARIPESIVDSWVSIIYLNTCKIISVSKLFGRAFEFPVDAVSNVFPDFKPKEGDEIRCAMNYLDGIGFYRWANSNGSGRLWTDIGAVKLYSIIKEYKDTMSPEEKLIYVNRVLDITHWNETLARYFIEGGETTCEKISGQRRTVDNKELSVEFRLFDCDNKKEDTRII